MRADREREYEVALLDGRPETRARALGDRIGSRRALLVTTPTVARLHANAIHEALRAQGSPVFLMVLDCREDTKDLGQVVNVCDAALECSLDRNAVLVGIGGGVCTDIVTMAASWIRRGIDYIRVPTTLIGLVDAGIGVKGGVNHAGKKSYLGCFYPPGSVLLEPAFLRSLPARPMRSGLAEIVKVAVACDPGLFDLVERHWPEFFAGSASPAVREIVWRSAVRLIEDLEPNLYEERTKKRLADLGHTFSPPLEAATGFELQHGEAVAVDIALSALLAERLGLIARADSERITGLLAAIGLELRAPALTAALCRRSIEEAASHRGGSLNLVLPTGIGSATFVESAGAIGADDITACLGALARLGAGLGGMARASNRAATPLP